MSDIEIKARIVLFLIAPVVFSIWAWGWWWLLIMPIISICTMLLIGQGVKFVSAVITGIALHSIDPSGYLSGWVWPVVYWAACLIAL